MPKNRERKASDIAQYLEALSTAKAVVFADMSAMKVNDNSALRREADKSAVEVMASKKTLLRKALKEAKYEAVDEKAMAGSVYMLAAHGDEIAPAKLVAGIAKKNDKIAILGGLLGTKWLSAAEVKSLAALPSKDQLIAQVVGTINAPLSGMMNVLQGNLRGLAQVLNGIKEAKS